MNFLTDDKKIADDLAWLMTNDPVFSRYFTTDTLPQRERGEEGAAGLIRIVLGQQVSTAAASSIWTKFTNQFNPTQTGPIIAASDDNLRACGLSRPKVKYIRGLAQAIEDKAIDIESWTNKDTETVVSEITSLKGFGLWSAQMFLMFNLARPDVWPHGDLGIQIGLGIYLNSDERPTEKETQAQCGLFKGRETAAALLLWSLKENKEAKDKSNV